MGFLLAIATRVQRGLMATLVLAALSSGAGWSTATAQNLDLAAPEARNDGWPVDRPLSAGFNETKLAALNERLLDGEFITAHAVVIEHDNALVYEHYRTAQIAFANGVDPATTYGPNTQHALWSVSKSITSLILGIVLENHPEVSLETPILDLLPADIVPLDPAAREITLEDALTMSAGLSWNEWIYRITDGRNKASQLVRHTDPLDYLFAQEMADIPGSRFSYNSGLTVALSGVIANLSERRFGQVATDALFVPLGVRPGGLPSGQTWGINGASMASIALTMSPRGLAKIGSLMLHHGQWQGKQVVPAEWIALSSTPYRVDADDGLYAEYGYHWWFRTFTQGGRSFPAIVARGLGGQRIFVLPEQNLVVTMLAWHDADHRWLSEKLLLEILDTLE